MVQDILCLSLKFKNEQSGSLPLASYRYVVSMGHFTVMYLVAKSLICCDRDQYLVSMITKTFTFGELQGLS